ncbi:AsmA family protein [Nitrospina gracilis]|uniref:AsmA family protein n=1 Tax=Nitrospina gracilis TaxID=35801 RepID=UPI001F3065A4|nr:hypothetical protein [Nitrospina gracilis Nb-211]
MKRIMLGLAAAVFLGILVLAALAYFVDVQSLKGPLTRTLTEATGMKVEIEGLAYNFQDGFRLKADGVSVESMDGKDKLVSAKNLFVNVYLMPLLAGKVEVKTIDLIQPAITIYLDQDTAPEEQKPDESQPEAEGTETMVNSIRGTFRNFQLAIDNIGIEQGRIYWIKRKGGKAIDQQMMRMSGIIQVSRPSSQKLDVTLSDLDVRLDKLHLQGDLAVHEVLTPGASLDVGLTLNRFTLEELQSINFFFPQDPSKIFKPYNPQGRFEMLQADMQVPLDALEDGAQFQQQAVIQAHLVGSNVSITAAGRTYPFDHLDSQVVWRRGNLNHHLDLEMGAGHIEHSGDLRISGTTPDPVLNTTTKVSQLELNRLGIPEVSQWGNGLVTGSLQLRGPATLEGLTLHASLSGDELLLTPADMQIGVGRWQADAEMKNRKLHNTLKATAFGGEVQHEGDLTFPADGNEGMMLDSTVTVNRIDVAQLPIPKSAGIGKGMLTGKLTAKGPVNDPDKLAYETSLVADDVLVTIQALDSMALPISRLDADATMQGRNIDSKVKAAMLNGELIQNGKITLPAPGNKKSVAELNSDFKLRKLDLSQAKWPAKWGLVKTVLSGDVKAVGPASIDRIRLTGNLQGEKMVLSPDKHNFSIQDAMVKINSKPPKIPVSLGFKLMKVNAKGYPFNRITGEITLLKDKVVLNRSAFVPPHGTMGVKGVYNTAKDKYDFSFGGKGLSIEDYEAKHLKGIVKFTGTLKGHVPEKGPATKGMNGDLKLLVTEGSLKELGAVKAILTILNPTALQKLSEKGLVFDRMGGTFKIKQGVVHTPLMGLEGQYLKVYLEGTADLNTETFDMNGKALPMGDLDKILQGVPLLGRFVAGSKTDEGLVETYFKLEGPFNDPKVDMEAAKSILAKPKRIFEALGDLLTGGAVTGK